MFVGWKTSPKAWHRLPHVYVGLSGVRKQGVLEGKLQSCAPNWPWCFVTETLRSGYRATWLGQRRGKKYSNLGYCLLLYRCFWLCRFDLLVGFFVCFGLGWFTLDYLRNYSSNVLPQIGNDSLELAIIWLVDRTIVWWIKIRWILPIRDKFVPGRCCFASHLTRTGDVVKIRKAVIGGSLAPLVMFLLWNAVILGTVSNDAGLVAEATGGVFDPLQVIKSVFLFVYALTVF